MTTRMINGSGRPHDLQRLEQALRDNAVDRIELRGWFDLGMGDERTTLIIDRPVTIVGAQWRYALPEEEEYGDIADPGQDQERAGPPGKPRIRQRLPLIRGGGAWVDAIGGHLGALFVDVPPPAMSQDTDVVISALHFEHSRMASIYVNRCLGLEIRHCDFREGESGHNNGFVGRNSEPVESVSAILAYGPGCRGRLRVYGNTCSFPPVPGSVPDDEQFLAVANTDFHAIRVISNTMSTRDDGIEILHNSCVPSAFPCEILVQGNTITIDQRVGIPTDEVWPLHTGILCCFNGPNGTDSNTQIVANTVTAEGPNVSAVAMSGEHFAVRDNTIEIRTDGERSAAFLFGVDIEPNVALGHLGASLHESDIFNNTIKGRARFGMFALDDGAPPPNDSGGNVIEDNNFAGFMATEVVYALGDGNRIEA